MRPPPERDDAPVQVAYDGDMSEKSGTPDSVAPALLLSMPQLRDPNFQRTVVLLCQHTDEGAWGLVLNRPTGKSATIMTREGEPVSNRAGLVVWLGGPVELERGCLLLGQMPEDGEALRVCDGLFLSGSPSLLQSLLDSPPQERTRLFMGYAGWGPGQLERELTESSWLIGDVELDLVFDTDPPAMWEAAIRRLGADPGTLQMSPGVH
jgi:putative transcriptional regulator